ncbi:MAG TPA: class I SAM-dependent methyltransferase [Acidimicrobiia bacterium]|nr:class I SAM-dependent methyltransferase [Acidimicrobiia bacterium]
MAKPTSNSREHWDDVYARRSAGIPPIDDAVGAAALAHFGDLEGKRLLDMGCGSGEYSLFFAQRGAQVTAIDLSDVGIEALGEECRRLGLTSVRPLVGDAFGIAEHGPFDAVFGAMILHHLEPFTDFVDVLAAATVPDARGFFYENSAMSRTLMWCREHLTGRYGIPKYGDDDEFPLKPQEIDLLRRAFDVELFYPELFLTRMASTYLLRGHGDRALSWVDAKLYRYPSVRRLSYKQCVLLERTH